MMYRDSHWQVALFALLLSSILFLVTKRIKEEFVDDQPEPPKSTDRPSRTYDSADHATSETSKMFLFAENKCDPKCCGMSEFSCSGGCVCKTAEQDSLLLHRGVNRISHDEF